MQNPVKLAEKAYSPAPLLPRSSWPVKETESPVKNPTEFLAQIWKNICAQATPNSQPLKVNWYWGLHFLLYPESELSANLFINGFYEPNETYLLTRLLDKNMVFLDIGANIGVYTLLASRLVGNNGTVIAVEPSRREYNRLLAQIKLNQLTNVKAIRTALGTSSKKHTLLNIAIAPQEGHNTLGNFAYEETRLAYKEKVKLATLDELINKEKIERLDFIKMDTEGAESSVLESGIDSISKYHPAILLEVSTPALKGQHHTPQDIYKFFKKIPYDLYRFDPRSGLPEKAEYLPEFINENILALPRHSPLVKMLLKDPLKNPQKPPLVSIVTTCYNSEQFIEGCVLSVLNQDYPYVEHVIADANSTDNTLNIIKKYAQGAFKTRIRWQSEPDKGQSDGLNKALRLTSGDILLVLNADDELLPHACSWAVANMEKYTLAGAIYGDTYIINESGQVTDIFRAAEFDFKKLLCVEIVPPAQATFIRRSALEKVGFRADKNLDTCPDYEMWVRLTLKFPMQHVDGVITRYRHHKIPQLDSKKPRTTHRAVVSKKLVMDRLFASRHTPASIKKLRRRAYAGLYRWSAATARNAKEYDLSFAYTLKAFWYKFSLTEISYLASLWKDSPLHYTKIVIKTLLQTGS